MKWYKILAKIFWDARGEGEGDPGSAGAGGQGDAPGDTGAGAPPAGTEGAGGDPGTGGGGQGGDAPVTPKYGDFGDSPKTIEEAQALLDRMYGENTKIKPEFETLRGKAQATEKNLANLRKTLNAHGIQALTDEEGNLRLEVVKQPTAQQKRFTDSHKNELYGFFRTPQDGEKFLNLLTAMLQDNNDTYYDGRQKQYQEQMAQHSVFRQTQTHSNDLMMSYFPQLDRSKAEVFNEAFYSRATEIWQEKFSKDARGELLAALEAARELNIIPQAVQAAKKEGFQQGQAGKKIIGPVGGGKKGGAGTQGGKLTSDEYSLLTPEKQAEYDKKTVGL
jgi:hypothetical protein